MLLPLPKLPTDGRKSGLKAQIKFYSKKRLVRLILLVYLIIIRYTTR